jgi:hypothetical protein
LEPDERAAYENLLVRADGDAHEFQVTVTGPLIKTTSGFVLEVRKFAPSTLPSGRP